MSDPSCEKCVFCDLPLELKKTTKLCEDGVKKIKKVCARVGKTKAVSCGQMVHKSCRATFVKEKRVSKAEKKRKRASEFQFSPKKTRSTSPSFDFKEKCFLCGEKVFFDDPQLKVHRITTSKNDFDQNIKTICEERNFDKWSTKVYGRISFVNDLFAADAVYHAICDVNFRTRKSLPTHAQCDSGTGHYSGGAASLKGRPVDVRREEAFSKVVEHCEKYFEKNECCSLIELRDKMKEFLCDTDLEPYSIVYLKKSLIEHFRDRIVIAPSTGNEDVIFFKDSADGILRQFYSEKRNENSEDEVTRLLKAAGKLIKLECRKINVCADYYPTVSEVRTLESCTDTIPHVLQVFLDALAPNAQCQLKKASLGQALMQMAARRSVLLPLQVALGVQMHHLSASKKIVDILHKMGFSISYAEVLKYERNAAAMSEDHFDYLNNTHFTQFIADNVDHNVNTIDGQNSFHGMGIIALITPTLETSKLIPRKNVTTKDICQSGKMKIHFYNGSDLDILRNYETLPNINAPDKFSNLDLLWKISWLLSPQASGWSGFMQRATSASAFPGKSSVMFFPLIDLNPGDFSCVYSTLLYIEAQAKKHGVDPVVTFDQPLFWKAQTIIQNEPDQSPLKRVVVRLGGFHTIMSFLGCIGRFMESTGIEEILSQIYGSNTINHILSGHNVTRATRAFMLLDAALNFVLIRKAFEIPEEHEMKDEDFSSALDHQTFQDLSSLLAGASGKSVPPEEICADDVWQVLIEKLKNVREKLVSTSRNSKLWFLFMDMVDLLRAFLRAERTGDWLLHLQTIQRMLPYFAAAGHSLYCKSVRLYLQNMVKLPESHPDVYKMFIAGHHVGRISELFWAGLSTDLIIEMILMKNIKSVGGLTRGAGFSESRRLTWLLGMPAFADINAAMTSLLQLDDKIENHKDNAPARQKRDFCDVKKLIQIVLSLSPFQPNAPLQNLATGRVASPDVNVDEAVEVGNKILESMDGKSMAEFSFKKSNTVKTMKSKNSIKIDDEVIHVDPYLLFQRLLCILNNRPESLHEFFSYELCSVPLALFKASGFLRPATKGDFTTYLLENIPEPSSNNAEKNTSYVIDGGHLLHLLPWPRLSTYTQIFQLYSTYVLRHYGCATIVFDGYSEKCTIKDMTHLKRSQGQSGPLVDFKNEMTLTLSKSIFLSNEQNKQKFLISLAEHLRLMGCVTIHAPDDADLYIVLEALKQAEKNPTVIIGKDTDLLAIAIHYFDETRHKNLYISDNNLNETEKKKKKKKKTKKQGQGTSSNYLDVKYISCEIEPNLKKNILFCHAFLGCDSTSQLFGITKGKIMEFLALNPSAMADAAVFRESSSSKEQLEKAGETILVQLYGGKSTDTLDSLRLKLFNRKSATSMNHVKPESLPPTSAAAKFHFHRVFLQVMFWMDNYFDPEFWGWKKGNSGFLPIMTDKPPAPESLLHVIRCSCAEDACSSQRCSCKKHGISCSSACKKCEGVTCSNKTPITSSTFEDEDDDYEDQWESCVNL